MESWVLISSPLENANNVRLTALFWARVLLTITADGVEYRLGYKDCLYITKGTKKVVFASDSEEAPAKFYMVSAPAHTSYETKLITLKDAAKRPLGHTAPYSG